MVPRCRCQRVWTLLRRLDLISVLQALYARAMIEASFGAAPVTGGFVVGMICTGKFRWCICSDCPKASQLTRICGTIQMCRCRLRLSSVVHLSTSPHCSPLDSSCERLSLVRATFGWSWPFPPMCVLSFHMIRKLSECAVGIWYVQLVWCQVVVIVCDTMIRTWHASPRTE